VSELYAPETASDERAEYSAWKRRLGLDAALEGSASAKQRRAAREIESLEQSIERRRLTRKHAAGPRERAKIDHAIGQLEDRVMALIAEAAPVELEGLPLAPLCLYCERVLDRHAAYRSGRVCNRCQPNPTPQGGRP
jgi:hypothetical protein